MTEKTIYVGTYGNEGIYELRFNNGIFDEPVKFADVNAAKYLASKHDRLYTICTDGNGHSGLAVINDKGIREKQLLFETITSCYVGCDDENIFVTNFHEGTYSLISYGLELERSLKIRDKAGCHQLLPFEDKLLGFAMYEDRIFIMDRNLDILDSIAFAENTGPRHGVLSVDQTRLYVIAELANEVFIIDTSDWKIISSIRLCNDNTAKSAAIRLYENRLYVSVRGADKVFIISVNDDTPVIDKALECCGRSPRDMIVIDGYIICANQLSGTVTCLNENGLLSKVQIPEAVALTIK